VTAPPESGTNLPLGEVHIRNNESASRYELLIGGELASILDYRVIGDRIVFPHTQTDQRFQGNGLAAQVVRAALDDARLAKRQVVPGCWFVAEFIDDHPDYRDLVSPAVAP
jgi:uncharacterized protein